VDDEYGRIENHRGRADDQHSTRVIKHSTISNSKENAKQNKSEREK
jgi:hypothetical protein